MNAPRVVVGTRCLVERRFGWGGVDHRWKRAVVKVTAKRAYFSGDEWFALDDPERVVKPRYLDYLTTVAEILEPSDESR